MEERNEQRASSMVLGAKLAEKKQEIQNEQKTNYIPVVRTKIGEQDRRQSWRNTLWEKMESVIFRRGRSGIIQTCTSRRQSIRLESGMVEKVIFAGASERIISGVGACREVK